MRKFKLAMLADSEGQARPLQVFYIRWVPVCTWTAAVSVKFWVDVAAKDEGRL